NTKDLAPASRANAARQRLSCIVGQALGLARAVSYRNHAYMAIGLRLVTHAESRRAKIGVARRLAVLAGLEQRDRDVLDRLIFAVGLAVGQQPAVAPGVEGDCRRGGVDERLRQNARRGGNQRAYSAQQQPEPLVGSQRAALPDKRAGPAAGDG